MSAWSAAKTWENELNEKDAGGWWGVDAQRRLGGSNKAQQLVASKSENSSAFLQCGFPILFPDLVAWPQDDIPGVGAHLSRQLTVVLTYRKPHRHQKRPTPPRIRN